VLRRRERDGGEGEDIERQTVQRMLVFCRWLKGERPLPWPCSLARAQAAGGVDGCAQVCPGQSRDLNFQLPPPRNESHFFPIDKRRDITPYRCSFAHAFCGAEM